MEDCGDSKVSFGEISWPVSEGANGITHEEAVIWTNSRDSEGKDVSFENNCIELVSRVGLALQSADLLIELIDFGLEDSGLMSRGLRDVIGFLK